MNHFGKLILEAYSIDWRRNETELPPSMAMTAQKGLCFQQEHFYMFFYLVVSLKNYYYEEAIICGWT